MVLILLVFIFILLIEFELIEKGIITMTIDILVPVICCLEISVAFRGLIFYILTVRIFLMVRLFLTAKTVHIFFILPKISLLRFQLKNWKNFLWIMRTKIVSPRRYVTQSSSSSWGGIDWQIQTTSSGRILQKYIYILYMWIKSCNGISCLSVNISEVV